MIEILLFAGEADLAKLFPAEDRRAEAAEAREGKTEAGEKEKEEKNDKR